MSAQRKVFFLLFIMVFLCVLCGESPFLDNNNYYHIRIILVKCFFRIQSSTDCQEPENRDREGSLRISIIDRLVKNQNVKIKNQN